jgi:hypothetical protein
MTSDIEERLKMLTEGIKELFLPQDPADTSRIELISKFYYHVLENMLVSEEQRLGTNNFSMLLSNETFHRSLLGCCCELVFFCFKMSQISFISILEKLNLKPLEFSKIIENVIRYEPEVPSSPH